MISKFPDIHSSNFRAKNIGFIFQFFNLFNEFSVKDNISIPLIPLGFSQKDIDKKVEESLKLANIFHKKDELVLNLSGGGFCSGFWRWFPAGQTKCGHNWGN